MATIFGGGGLQSYEPFPTKEKKETSSSPSEVYKQEDEDSDMVEIYKAPGTDRPGGIEINGKTYFGLSPQDIDLILGQENERRRQLGEAPLTSELAGETQRQQRFKQEDVELLQERVAEQEGYLAPSLLQQRNEQALQQREQLIQQYMQRNNSSRAEAELAIDKTYPEASALISGDLLKLDSTQRVKGTFERFFGGVGQEFIGLGASSMLDALQDRPKVEEVAKQMSELSSLLPAIEGVTTSGGINPYRTLAELNQAQKDIDIIHANINRAVSLDPAVELTGEYDALMIELRVLEADLRDARSTALEVLREGDPQFNQLETQYYLDEMDKTFLKK